MVTHWFFKSDVAEQKADMQVARIQQAHDLSISKTNLISYVAGRYPSRQQIVCLCKHWGVPFTLQVHNLGWLVFRFNSHEHMANVHSQWPHFVQIKPLVLKVMLEFFDVSNENLSCTLCWAQLHHLPLELWFSDALSDIMSLISNPLCIDMLTASGNSLLCQGPCGNWFRHRAS